MKMMTGLFIVGSLMTVACGPTKNNPLENYKHLNLSEQAQASTQKVKYELIKETKEIPVIKTEYVEVKTEVPVIQEKAVYIINCPETLLKESEDNYKACLENLKSTAEQISINGPVYEVKTYSDAQLQKQEAMIFTEGQESTYYISAKNLFKSNINFNLLIEDYPQDAVVTKIQEKTNEAKYKITWTPKKGIVKAGETEARAMIRATLENIQFVDSSEAVNEIMRITFDAVSKTSEKEIIVVKESPKKSPTTAQTQNTKPAQTVLGGERR